MTVVSAPPATLFRNPEDQCSPIVVVPDIGWDSLEDVNTYREYLAARLFGRFGGSVLNVASAALELQNIVAGDVASGRVCLADISGQKWKLSQEMQQENQKS